METNMANENKVAVITGASRGIGRGVALELAKAGFDVVVCARTVQEGEQREHSSTVRKSDTSALPGSLEKTAQEVEALGRRALPVKLDLNLVEDVENVAEQTLKTFGRVDVLVNNARYIGPGHMDLFEDTPIEVLEAHDRCNVLAPLRLIKLLVPKMVEQGGGIVFNVTSGAGWQESPNLPGQGGWGLGYSISKAGLNRVAFGLAKEFKQHNVAVVNLEPGYVGTERIAQDMAAFGFGMEDALPVNVPGLAIAYIATHKYPMFYSCRTIDAPSFVVEHMLIDAENLPANYGPAGWGIPSGFRWTGEGAIG
jgi:NAD(P)-dependent dehydrogenase (short-subunit alcohol dehydrogenase family)